MRMASVFFLGIIVGILGLFAVGVIRNRLGYSDELTAQHKRFGGIEIWAQKPVISNSEKPPADFYQKVYRMLWMTKDGSPFLMMSQGTDGNVNCLYLLKNKDEPVLVLEPLNSPGKWGKVSYSNCEKGRPVGDAYRDIDFDGRFDFKLVADSNGNLLSRFIFVNGDWQTVDHCNLTKMAAMVGDTEYLFDPNSGVWYEKADVSK